MNSIVVLENYGNIVNNIIPSGILITDNSFVEDFRYTNITSSSDGAFGKYLVYGLSSGVYTMPFDMATGGLVAESGVVIFPTTSGSITKVETTNFQYPGQYIFTTVSGEVSTFYQQDPEASGIGSGVWFECPSGFPSSQIITRIRIDDRL
jgi:hypothetical protein